MAYQTKQLNLVAPNVGSNQGGSVWTYQNLDADNNAAMIAAGFLADAVDKGLENGDIVIAILDSGGTETYGVTLLGAATTVLVP